MKRRNKRERCPTCTRGTLSPKLLDLPVRAGGARVIVHDILVQACDECDEEIIEASEILRAKEIARVAAAGKRRAA